MSSAPETGPLIQSNGPPRAARSLSADRAAAAPLAQTLLAWLAAGLLLLAGLLGGGQGGAGDALVQLAALGLLGFMAWGAATGRLDWSAAGSVVFVPLIPFVLPLFQLLPLGSGMWEWGSARHELALQLAAVGVEPLRRISLNPTATESALYCLLPAGALFLAVLALDARRLRPLLWVLLLLAIANVLMGMAQLGGGRGSDLRLYIPTNVEQAVGFFANRNHMASLLAMVLPLPLVGAAWALVERLRGRNLSPLYVLSGCAIAVLLIVGITMTGSRGGLLCGMLGVLGAWGVAMGMRQQRGTRRVLLVTVIVAAVLAIQMSMVGVLQRMDEDPQEEGRWQYARVTLRAASDYLPWGSGLGTFRQAYQPYEAAATPTKQIINHAHDDYLELWLEGGWLALVLIATGLLLWLRQGWQLWRRDGHGGDSPRFGLLLARTAWVSASLGIVHSALDYPLRTTAAMSVFAVLAAIAFRNRARNGAVPET